jgi:hypothetical protein
MKNEEVLLVLTHRRVGDKHTIIIGALAGWHTHLNILADQLAGKPPRGFWKIHTSVERDYDQQLT